MRIFPTTLILLLPVLVLLSGRLFANPTGCPYANSRH